ncbi:MAG: hypothetical protein GXO90_00660 [FCB group bacterium]|nr:hypothetical protein [FCB group bacterium]
MRYIQRFFFPFLLLSALFGSVPGDSLVWIGVNKFYNYETAEAIDVLTQARQAYPENPTVHLTWAAARWLHSQANDPVETTYTILEESLNDIVPVYQSLVAKYPDRPEYQLYLGSAIGLKARVDLGRKEWFNTLVDAYRGFQIIQDVAEKNPEMVDAQLPIGIVETFASMSGFLVRWSAILFGLNPDQTEGLSKIETAANQGDFSWIEASSIKSFLDLWVYQDFPSALRHSEHLATRFPKNFYFNILYVESLIRTHQSEKAGKQLEYLSVRYGDLTKTQQKWYGGYLAFEEGLFAAERGDWDTAFRKSSQAIEVYGAEMDVILANAWLLKGMCLDVFKDREGALTAYRSTVKLDNLTAAVKAAEHYQKQAFLPEEFHSP